MRLENFDLFDSKVTFEVIKISVLFTRAFHFKVNSREKKIDLLITVVRARMGTTARYLSSEDFLPPFLSCQHMSRSIVWKITNSSQVHLRVVKSRSD